MDYIRNQLLIIQNHESRRLINVKDLSSMVGIVMTCVMTGTDVGWCVVPCGNG